ncbi:MAG: hypothetical protein PHC28_13460 [Flavobacterium sp.]|uniref:hypothetical protein n=1 Tax=Flavobacterium sp. TaxID=239 RepID=UPI002627E880|nr:hypothetical protein [Flavobacterium sp.]MDD5151460.1 hypothetical protein [Flavobacterium sp.]
MSPTIVCQALKEERYYQLFCIVKSGYATIDQQIEFTNICNDLFKELIEDNKEIFVRLKNI